MLSKEMQELAAKTCWDILELTQQEGPAPARYFAMQVNRALICKYGNAAPRMTRKSVVRYIRRASPKARGIRRGWTLPTLLSQQEHIEIQSKSAVSILRNQVAPSLLDAMCLVKQIVETQAVSVSEQIAATELWNNIGHGLSERLSIGRADIQAMLGVASKRARLVFEG